MLFLLHITTTCSNAVKLTSAYLSCFWVQHIHTSEIADEVVKFHLAVWLDVLVMKIRVEHDDGKRKQENSVSTTELTHHVWITLRVAASKRLPHTQTDTQTGVHRDRQRHSTMVHERRSLASAEKRRHALYCSLFN